MATKGVSVVPWMKVSSLIEWVLNFIISYRSECPGFITSTSGFWNTRTYTEKVV